MTNGQTNVHLHPSEETLMAYADGELGEDVALAVEQAMTNDPALIKELVAFTRSRRLARVALARSHGFEAASPELVSAASASSPPDVALAGLKPPWWSGLASSRRWMAGASLAAATLIMVAGSFGYFLGASPFYREARTALSHVDDADVSAVLHKAASGQRQPVAGGVLDPIATYRLEDGTLCRDYVLIAAQSKVEALACRRDSAWQTVAAFAKPANDGYAPASGESVIDAYLEEIKAGSPLSPEDEGRLLAP